MRRGALAILLALAGACTRNQVFVRSIAVDGREIVVVKCVIAYRGDQVTMTDNCATETLQLPSPVTAVRGAPGAAP